MKENNTELFDWKDYGNSVLVKDAVFEKIATNKARDFRAKVKTKAYNKPKKKCLQK